MAETTRFELEGDITLAYMSDDPHGKHILIQKDGEPVRLEEYIAQQLDFPSNFEFDAMMNRLDQLRGDGLQPAEGEPDITREGVKLRISVEVLD